ncbi:MAG: DUF6250 domain-containing protein [Opitutus sp.]
MNPLRAFVLILAALLAGPSLIVAGSGSEPTADLSLWQVEQMPGGTVRCDGDSLVIEDAAGCTVWFREKLTAPVEISYDVTIVSRGGAYDRVSDLNCFWMARDPAGTDACPFSPDRKRGGRFSDYDSLETYYVGMGGNENSTTRFRRYNGTSARPLLPKHDLRDPAVLLTANRTYHLRVVARDGIAEFWRDGEKVFAFTDPTPLRAGWFGFRTVKSHWEIRHFEVKRGASAPTSPGGP